MQQQDVQSPRLQQFSLDDRYESQSGVVFLSGIQALVRMVLEQGRLDRRAGLRTGGFVSGYRGSPLGGLDRALWQQRERLKAQNVHFQPGVNEELAATAVWGSQQVGLFAGARSQGVYGLWYGKAPGLDRATDAIRHGNAAGTSPHGGVVLVVGDDHGCKSSTLPSHSELALKDLGVPILNPADVQDVLDLGLFGWALSRYAGCWAGLIALADTMDSAQTVTLSSRRSWIAPTHEHDVHIVAGRAALEQEQLLMEVKLPLAARFAAANGINRSFGVPQGRSAALGIVTTGKAYLDARQALYELGIRSDEDLAGNGIRLLKLGMSWPLDATEIGAFVAGVDTVLVVEEKRPFVEQELKSLLFRSGVEILGKEQADGTPLLPSAGELSGAHVARAIARCLERVPNPGYLEQLDAWDNALATVTGLAKTDRLPMFCAGCPHSTSTRIPEGSRASAGIGCHYMAQWMDRETATFTQMGGEGANWVGQAPFTDTSHIFVNLGDGTYFHSGILAIRQAVAAGINVTYKILYNDAVAMTGGQPLDGSLSVAELVAQLEAEGVRRISVVSDAPEQHRELHVDVAHRDDLDRVQRELREETGCSVIVYQQTCATELRRRRKRGLAPDPDVRVVINDAVCEGCGDCSVQSNCVAVEPLPTALGVKRRINQTACNKDLSCLKGFCPAFVLVEGGELARPAEDRIELDALRTTLGPVVPPSLDQPLNVLIAGVGGTGVVTVSALLGTAAHLDGLAVATMDMTGLAQKGGAVFSHVRIAETNKHLHGARIGPGKADLLLACDLITGASRDAMRLLNTKRSVAVVNGNVAPTAEFVLHQNADVQSDAKLARLRRFAARVEVLEGASLAERVFGDTTTLNVLMLGYAYQIGKVPLTLRSLEKAIEINGVAVTRNLKAFHLGRLAVFDPERLNVLTASTPEPGAPMDGSGESIVELDELIDERLRLLTAYQNKALAERYRALVLRVQTEEQRLDPKSQTLTRAVAVSYARLLAYKDEYEVARLYRDGRFATKIDGAFTGQPRLEYLMAPPLLGEKKRRFGPWLGVALDALRCLKGLRGSWLDPFGYTAERQAERHSIKHFEGVVEELLAGLEARNLALASQIAALPQTVAGFGSVKARARERWQADERALLERFRHPLPLSGADRQAA